MRTRRSTAVAGLVFGVRYLLPGVLLVAAVVLLVTDPGGNGPEGFGLFAGAAGSILVTNVLLRLGESSSDDRVKEDEAREYFTRYGRWPDEEE